MSRCVALSVAREYPERRFGGISGDLDRLWPLRCIRCFAASCIASQGCTAGPVGWWCCHDAGDLRQLTPATFSGHRCALQAGNGGIEVGWTDISRAWTSVSGIGGDTFGGCGPRGERWIPLADSSDSNEPEIWSGMHGISGEGFGEDASDILCLPDSAEYVAPLFWRCSGVPIPRA